MPSISISQLPIDDNTSGWSGMLAADMACHQDNDLIGYMQGLGKPNKFPRRHLLDPGVREKFAWEIWNARAEA